VRERCGETIFPNIVEVAECYSVFGRWKPIRRKFNPVSDKPITTHFRSFSRLFVFLFVCLLSGPCCSTLVGSACRTYLMALYRLLDYLLIGFLCFSFISFRFYSFQTKLASSLVNVLAHNKIVWIDWLNAYTFG